jgi:hypothetical protein
VLVRGLRSYHGPRSMGMNEPHDPTAVPASPVQTRDGPWRFVILFGMQTIGAAVLFWNGLPLYQQVVANPAVNEPQFETLVWSVSSIVLIQAGYWISYRLRPPLPQFTNALLGHVILFLARMSFVFATSVFGFIFIMQKQEFHIPAFRYILTLAGLFSLYCYVLELENVGRAFLGREKKSSTATR